MSEPAECYQHPGRFSPVSNLKGGRVVVEPEYTQEELESEEWRPVVGYEGWYSVSNLGRVRREHKNTNSYPGRVLRPGRTRRGYLHVGLYRNGRCWPVDTHVLVAHAFLGPCPPDHEVNHKDENTGNSRLSNLEYLTHRANLQHSIRNFRRGGQHSNAKITAEQVRELRALYATGEHLQKNLAVRFGVSKMLVSLIVNNKIWRECGD